MAQTIEELANAANAAHKQYLEKNDPIEKFIRWIPDVTQPGCHEKSLHFGHGLLKTDFSERVRKLDELLNPVGKTRSVIIVIDTEKKPASHNGNWVEFSSNGITITYRFYIYN